MHIVKDRSTGYQNNSGVHLSYQCRYFYFLADEIWPVLVCNPHATCKFSWAAQRNPANFTWVNSRMSYITYLLTQHCSFFKVRSSGVQNTSRVIFIFDQLSWPMLLSLYVYQNTCHLFMTYFSDHFHQDSKTIAENWGNWTVLWPIQS